MNQQPNTSDGQISATGTGRIIKWKKERLK